LRTGPVRVRDSGEGWRRAVLPSVRRRWDGEGAAPRTGVRYARVVADLPIAELVENRRRSIAMLPPGSPALNRDEALELLEQLKAALGALRDIWTNKNRG
jgi:hypothetical protein